MMLRASGLRFIYGGAERPALDGVDIEVGSGEHTLIMGPTGAGKTTLCCALRGLLGSFLEGELSGELSVADSEITPARGAARSIAAMAPLIGLVFQDFEKQLFSTSVAKEIAFGPENMRLERAEIRRRVEWAMALVGLERYGDRAPAALSGGEKQRLAIASVLAMQPRMLVLDEPTTDLDPAGKEQIFGLREKLAGVVELLVMVEHEIEPALSFDRIVLFSGGRVVESGGRSLLAQAALFERHAVQPWEPAVVGQAIGVEGLEEERIEAALMSRARPPQCAPIEIAPGNEAVTLSSIGFGYGEAPVLDDLSLTIGDGEFVAILGANGCGKTTTAKIMAGLLKPTHGEVRLFGESIRGHDFAWIASRVGYVFQNPDHQIFASTIAEEVAFGAKNMGLAGDELTHRVKDVLATVGLDLLAASDPFTQPKGYRQMVAVASVLAMRPRILILDEPTTGLDLAGQRGVFRLLEELHGAGHTIVVITHSMRAALAHAQRTIVMKDGRIIADGRSDEVFYGGRLEDAGLRVPPIVRLGRAAGVRARHVGELMAAIGEAS